MPGGGFSLSSNATAEDAPGPYTLGDFCIDEYKPIKVIVIGAGFAGITAGIRFPQKIPNVELTIYEKSAGVGGTWFNNNYPGLACDVPSHCYQLSFEEKKDWSSFYACGHEIRQHLEEVVEKYKLMRYIKLQHEVVHAQFDSAAGKWRVRVRRPNPESGALEEIEDSSDVLLLAVGILSRWEWPDIAGLKDFKGELRHSADFDKHPKTWQDVAQAWADKKVGVVGVGSSAIQIVSALQPKVQKLVNYVRGKTWLALPFGQDLVAKLLGRESAEEGDYHFTPEEIERFKNDPEFFWNFRYTLETTFNSAYSWTLKGSELQKQTQLQCRENMEKKLAKKPWIAEHLIPDFPVACRRLTPGPGYLEALCEDNVDFVPTPIKRVTERGIETEDGKFQELDVIICATGYDTSYQLPFKILGRGGVDLNEKWKPHPVTYLTIAVDQFPNMFIALGPNAAVASGMLLPLIEQQIMYAVQATAKMQRERLKSMEVKAEAVRDFDEYLEAYFPRTVFTEKCRSWYKLGKEEGRVTGLWPGSTLQAVKAIEHPRWEDYNYELADPVKNRFYWLGDGQTLSEKTLTGDRTHHFRWDLGTHGRSYSDRPSCSQ
ncbi:FAD/NAD-P-binding domain-containing protein [Pilatotrama ljubarskyi]|nr:FAD/NAD-P-binding domain-containing protein [Pilatotrama ljubarskyi]